MRSSSPPSEKKKNSKKQVKRGEGGRSAVREGTGGKGLVKEESYGVQFTPFRKKNKQTNRHCNSLGVGSRQQHLPDKFEYSHYLFAG